MSLAVDCDFFCGTGAMDYISSSLSVNDLGVDLTGLGKSSQPVDEVVATIRSRGGIAVHNYGEKDLCVCVTACTGTQHLYSGLCE